MSDEAANLHYCVRELFTTEGQSAFKGTHIGSCMVFQVLFGQVILQDLLFYLPFECLLKVFAGNKVNNVEMAIKRICY